MLRTEGWQLERRRAGEWDCASVVKGRLGRVHCRGGGGVAVEGDAVGEMWEAEEWEVSILGRDRYWEMILGLVGLSTVVASGRMVVR